MWLVMSCCFSFVRSKSHSRHGFIWEITSYNGSRNCSIDSLCVHNDSSDRYSLHESFSDRMSESVPLIDNAFPQHLTAFRIVEISGTGINLMIQLLIGIVAYYKMSHDPKTGRPLKFMFLLSFLLACITTIAFAVSNVLEWLSFPDHQFAIAVYISFGFDCLFLGTLLATLILRLHLTFSSSAYRMCRHTICLFVLVFVILLLLTICLVTSWILIYNDYEHIGNILYWSSFFSFMFVYAFGSFFAVRFFVKNMSKLAQRQHDSQREVTLSAEAIALCEQQRKLLNLSAKYISLFVIAILSSILVNILVTVVSFEMAALFFSFDYCLNLFCLYLQFGCANGHYKRCCSFVDSHFQMAVKNRTRKLIHRISSGKLPTEQKVTKLRSTSPTSSPGTPASCSMDIEEGGTVNIENNASRNESEF